MELPKKHELTCQKTVETNLGKVTLNLSMHRIRHCIVGKAYSFEERKEQHLLVTNPSRRQGF